MDTNNQMSTPTPETDAEQLRKVLRKQSRCIYIAVESSVADPIAAAMNMAASMLEDLETRLRAAEAERDMYKTEHAATVEACLWMHYDSSLAIAAGTRITVEGVKALKHQRDALKARVEELERKLESHVAVYNSLFDEAKKMQRKLADYERPVENNDVAAACLLAEETETPASFELLNKLSRESGTSPKKMALRILARAYRQQAASLLEISTIAFDATAGRSDGMSAKDAVQLMAKGLDVTLQRCAKAEADLADEKKVNLGLAKAMTESEEEAKALKQQLAQFEGAYEVKGIGKVDIVEFWDIGGHAEGCGQIEARRSVAPGTRVFIVPPKPAQPEAQEGGASS